MQRSLRLHAPVCCTRGRLLSRDHFSSSVRFTSRPCRQTGKAQSKTTHRPRMTVPASSTVIAEQATEQDFTWKGSDEFSDLGDRKDLPPEPLPALTSPKRVVLVRHGQSTWNAEGRIQGSTDFAVLTQKGQAQADTTRGTVSDQPLLLLASHTTPHLPFMFSRCSGMSFHNKVEDVLQLLDDNFDMLVHSPLARAKETAEIIWGNRKGKVHVLPSLREVDLYSFQGLIKQEGKQRYGEQFAMWQKRASEFEIDGQAPVRELWYRASLAWQEILSSQNSAQSTLLVAHNAVNQALVATAIGLPPTYFRRLLQNNAATTVLDFQPNEGGPPRVNVDRLNQSPGPPFQPDEVGVGVKARIIFVRHGATLSSEDQLLMGTKDEELSTLGEMQAGKTAELIMDLKVKAIMCSPLKRAQATARTVSKLQQLAHQQTPETITLDGLTNRAVGEWEGRHALEAKGRDLHHGAESLDEVWQRAADCWQQAVETVQRGDEGQGPHNVVVVGHSIVTAAMLGHCLGLGHESMSLFKADCGGVTVVEFPHEIEAQSGIVQCINYTAHLGRWSVPITNEDMDAVCGIEGCF